MYCKISFMVMLATIQLLVNACESGYAGSTKESGITINEEVLTNDELLDKVQKQTIDYFWAGAEPNSGMAAERIHLDGIYPDNDQKIVTTGGTGFGLMGILVGIERGFISRDLALARLDRIVTFLEAADRFHGAWPHWLDGTTGKTKPFSPKDDGADLVETAFLVQGLLTVKEYFNGTDVREKLLGNRIQKLWEEVEWDWFTQGQDVLYWHWSPNHQWQMNFAVRGYNECLIMYVLAAASPTHPISKVVYEKGWARNGAIKSDTSFYGLPTVLDHYETNDEPVGPLFWAHYSYLGLNPKGLEDQYADYWKLNVNHSLINYRYCVDNPKNFKGYGSETWGLTASYSANVFYEAHRPGQDVGVITPTAALSSMPYTPNESMAFLRNLYQKHDSLVGKYGPYDAFSEQYNWYLPRYLAIDQGPIPVMIENYRTGLLWNLFMKNNDVIDGLSRLGFTHK
ncbi:MAG: beta-glucosidase [Flavobacteriales bacterium]|nr:MAG: beta-glucosidase [Flavobacteriales bacterium]